MSTDIKFQTHSHSHIEIDAPSGLGLRSTSEKIAQYVTAQSENVRTWIQLPGVYWEDGLLAFWGSLRELDCVPLIQADSQKISIETRKGPVQIPMGNCTIKVQSDEDKAYYDLSLKAGVSSDDECDEPFVMISVKAPGLLSDLVKKIEEKIRENINLGTYSKIKGSIVTIEFPYRRGDGCFNMARHTAKYETLQGNLEDLVFNQVTNRRIHTQILQRIRRRELLAGNGVRFQSNHMLVGAYGTGKTALLNAVLNEASSRGFTCLFIKDARDLEFANEWVRQYEPALLVVEDVNRLMESDNDSRTCETDHLTNVLDGVSTKGRSLMTIFTVNDVERILPVFLRPGRMTSLIEMEPLDAESSFRLLRKVCSVSPNTDSGTWMQTIKEFGPQSPSTITQIGASATILAGLNDRNIVLPEDIIEAFDSMKLQLRLVNRAPHIDLSVQEKAATIMAKGVVEHAKTHVRVSHENRACGETTIFS